MTDSFLKHIVALAHFMKTRSLPSDVPNHLNKETIDGYKGSIWHSYVFAEFYCRTIEELYDPKKAKWSVPSDYKLPGEKNV